MKRKNIKPSLKARFFALFDKNFFQKIDNAKGIKRMIEESTKGSINHFYDMNGEQIRGYSNYIVRSRKVDHPLISKYR